MPQYQLVYTHRDYGDAVHIRRTYSDGDAAGRALKEYSSIHTRENGYVWKIRKLRDDGLPDEWREREAERFKRGDYEQVPWHDEAWYQPKHGEHFAHLSLKQIGKIAYTEDAAKGEADRQTIISPGRYLKKHFGDTLTADDIEKWAAEVSIAAGDCCLKITQDADEIEEVYHHGPNSCMAGSADDFEGVCHPSRVYAGPDLAVAYTGPSNDASGRVVIWPEKKIYSTIYGDCTRMRKLLADEGYECGSLSGARVRRIKSDYGFVMPYVDGISYAEDEGEYIRLGRGSIHVQQTSGVAESAPRCDCCGGIYDEGEGYSVSDERWCEHCADHHATYDEISEEHYSRDNVTVVTLYAFTYPAEWAWTRHLSWSHLEFTTTEETMSDHPEVLYVEDRDEWWCRRTHDFLTTLEAFARATADPAQRRSAAAKRGWETRRANMGLRLDIAA